MEIYNLPKSHAPFPLSHTAVACSIFFKQHPEHSFSLKLFDFMLKTVQSLSQNVRSQNHLEHSRWSIWSPQILVIILSTFSKRDTKQNGGDREHQGKSRRKLGRGFRGIHFVGWPHLIQTLPPPANAGASSGWSPVLTAPGVPLLSL